MRSKLVSDEAAQQLALIALEAAAADSSLELSSEHPPFSDMSHATMLAMRHGKSCPTASFIAEA